LFILLDSDTEKLNREPKTPEIKLCLWSTREKGHFKEGNLCTGPDLEYKAGHHSQLPWPCPHDRSCRTDKGKALVSGYVYTYLSIAPKVMLISPVSPLSFL
jgi:hypothetical protein